MMPENKSPHDAGKSTHGASLSPVSRRYVLKATALGGGIAVAHSIGYPGIVHAVSEAGAENPIVVENQNPGTTDWQLTFVRSRDYRSEAIEGYCSSTSVRSGESIDIFLSVEPSTDVVIDIYRMGHYGGKGGRFMQRLGPFPVEPQLVPSVGEHRLRECRWARTTRFTVPEDWISGAYLGKLSCEAHRYESYVIFIVRDDRKADLLFQCSDTTWQAYNKWPSSFSVYDSNPPQRASNATSWVSYDRPYGKYPQVVDQPLSQGSGSFLLWEYPLSFWLEGHGYDVTYWSNIDTHRDWEGLDRVKCFLSIGHDEYWSLNMFDNVKRAVDQGLNAAFLSGNSIHWVIPLDKRNDQGLPHRIIHRAGRFGGVEEEALAASPHYDTEPWETHGPDEKTLIGGRSMVPANGSGDWIVVNADHWLFKGTNMKNGDRIPGLVGWEHHGDPADIPGLEVLAEGTVLRGGVEPSPYAATIYPGPKGNWVFNAATIFWSMGLSNPPGLLPPHSHFGRPHGVDERVQQITSNFLEKCGIWKS